MTEEASAVNGSQSGTRGGRGPRGASNRNDTNRGRQPRVNTDGRTSSHRGGRSGLRGRGRGQKANGLAQRHMGLDAGQPPELDGGRSDDQASADSNCTLVLGSKRNENGISAEEEEEGDTCFICASNIDHISIAPCNHQTCHICALRLRALYKTRACAHCRTESNFVVFTDDPTKRYEDFKDSDFVKTDDNLGIRYEKEEIFEDTVLLLRYNCPDKTCDVACLGWPHLHRHVKAKHGKTMCDLCTRNKKVFTHEHELFTFGELRRHERYGDDNPGALDQSGFKGHPECGFCRERFYGDDELYVHCREKHERCHICDRRNNGRQPQYYLNYEALEEHFRKDHFLCLDQECLGKKFVVFDSEMDLKAHQLAEHPNGLSKDARRDARLVDISGFDYRAPYQAQRGRREGRGGGRGRDPNSEPLPVSSAQPLRRDELAYQRQMAIQSAQSSSTRTFGGQLTQSVREPVRPAPSTQPTPPLPAVENLSISDPQSMATLSPQEQARRLRHNAVIERASNLLGNDALKLNEFRSKVSAYKNSTITATNLIDAFFSLFDTSSAEMGKLVKELADIYENETKRTELLKSWNDWRAINEDYPSLPGPNGTVPGMTSDAISGSSSGRRVLRLKSSTAQSSRSAVGSGNPFPPLGRPTNAAAKKSPAWGALAKANGSASSSASSSRTPSRHPTTSSSSEAFPALPAAAKPNTLMAGLTKGSIRWQDTKSQPPAANAWNPSGGAPSAQVPATGNASLPSQSDESTTAKKKGKKAKGQVLYQWG